MTVLEITDLTKVVDQKTLLNNINLLLTSSHIYGLIGENGAGKTTLFRCLLGLSSFVGKIYIDNELVTKNNINEFLKKIGFISPFPDSYDSLTIEEVFEQHIRYYGVACIEAEKYLKEFNLARDKKVKDLSRGMKMKLMIAVAFSHEAKLLILDEPTSGLDPVARDEFLDILRDYIEDEEKSVIFKLDFPIILFIIKVIVYNRF